VLLVMPLRHAPVRAVLRRRVVVAVCQNPEPKAEPELDQAGRTEEADRSQTVA
jgi:hypothetical protein